MLWQCWVTKGCKMYQTLNLILGVREHFTYGSLSYLVQVDLMNIKASEETDIC